MASHGAARRAVENGYTDEAEMVDGLKGWAAAGQPTIKPPDAT
jgi:rhodanese-related sulfurtransferase